MERKMNNFAEYLTPEQAVEKHEGLNNSHTLEDFRKMAKNEAMCEICGHEKVWKMADTGMCFTCTTGEADASDDYELM